MKKKIFLLGIALFSFSALIIGCGNKETSVGKETAGIVSGTTNIDDEKGNEDSSKEKETLQNIRMIAENSEEKLPVEVKYSCELGSISIQLPEDWEYTIEEYTNSESGFGICFYPTDAVDGSVAVRYWKGFGVCGTGLKESEITVNGMPARMGVYDNQSFWSFIVLREAYEGYVITNEGAGIRWDDYGEIVEEILDTLVVNE